MGTHISARGLVTVGSIWEFPDSCTPDTRRRVVSVSPFIKTIRMNGTFGGDWRAGVEEFLARHDYVSEGPAEK